jgi:hypothetical protein
MAEGAFGRSDAEIDLLVRGMRSGIAVVGFGYIGTVIGAAEAGMAPPRRRRGRATVAPSIGRGPTRGT